MVFTVALSAPPRAQFAMGLIGTLYVPGPQTLANTMLLKSTADDVAVQTVLMFDDFESVQPGRKNLDTTSAIAAKWPFAAPPIGNQMQCGCCWAYSNAKTAAARYAIHTNQGSSTPSITSPMASVDAVIACADQADLQTAQGCNGGIGYTAWQSMALKGTAYTIFGNMSTPTGSSVVFQATNPCINGTSQCQSTPMLPCGDPTSTPCASYTCANFSNPKSFSVAPVAQAQPSPLRPNTSDVTSAQVYAEGETNFSVVPYWNGISRTPPNPDGSSMAVSSLDMPFYAACLQHEMSYGGPVQVSLLILDISAFQSYTGGLVIFTKKVPESGNSYAGHAMMLTGFHWVSQDYLTKNLSATEQAQYTVGGTNYLSGDYTIKQLVWHVANQWGDSWGDGGCVYLAASFFMATDKSGAVSFVPLPIQSCTGLELNCAAGNFYPAKAPQAIHVARHIAKYRFGLQPTITAEDEVLGSGEAAAAIEATVHHMHRHLKASAHSGAGYAAPKYAM